MGTHPIFESDFDCLTEFREWSCEWTWRAVGRRESDTEERKKIYFFSLDNLNRNEPDIETIAEQLTLFTDEWEMGRLTEGQLELIRYNVIIEVHNQNIKYKQAREERLTSKYKQSRIQHKEQLKEKSAQLASAFVDFQKRAAKMSPKDMDSDSEMAVLRVTLQDQFAAFHDLELAFKLEEAELLEKELAEMEEKNQKKSLFQTLEHTDGSIEACQACKKYEESAKFRAKFKKVKDQQMRKSGRGKVKWWFSRFNRHVSNNHRFHTLSPLFSERDIFAPLPIL